MYKTTILLPSELKLLAEEEARRRGISLGEMIRIALKKAIELPKRKQKKDSLFDFHCVYKGPCEKNTSADHDQYLYGEK